ncbi:hypothetical protein ABE504_14505 [Paenibacillus oryzisoli]|uniref:hypothetical protein n=1 Tax=Paenibacillus oryzisoli TaxID=1850517 RepID=UPI003D2C8D4B
MDHAAVFTNFRPIYVFFIVILLILLALLITSKMKSGLIDVFFVLSIVGMSSVVSAFMTYQIGILSDELGIGGDPVSFIMFIVIVALSIANLFVYFGKKRK